MSRTHRPSNRINMEKSTVTHPCAPKRLRNLAGAAAFAAVLFTGPSVAASLLPVAPPLDKPEKMFEFEVKLKAPQFRDGVITKVGQIEAKAKREIFVNGIKQTFERKQKQDWNGLGGVPFLFAASPTADSGLSLSVTVGNFLSLEPLVLNASQAAATPRLLELAVEVESRSKDLTRRAALNLSDLRFNSEVFTDLIALTAPFQTGDGEIDDEAEAKFYFALPGGIAITAPYTFSGTLVAEGDWKEVKVKAIVGDATFLAPPADSPVAVSEPQTLALLFGGLVGLGLTSLSTRRMIRS